MKTGYRKHNNNNNNMLTSIGHYYILYMQQLLLYKNEVKNLIKRLYPAVLFNTKHRNAFKTREQIITTQHNMAYYNSQVSRILICDMKP